MNALNILDVSALIYTGSASEFYRERSNYGFYVGGIHYLMKQVAVSFTMMDSVLLCFDSPSFRKELMAGYKAGRVFKPDVYTQIQFAFDSLLGCGFHCAKFDGYEADDIISWASDKWYNDYSEIVIIGNDHDLCHNVRGKVRFKSIVPGTPCIYSGNFERFADSTHTKFNTISAKKCLCGCKSDKIGSMSLACGLKGQKLYLEFLSFLEKNKVPSDYSTTADPRYLVAFSKLSGLFTEEEQKDIITRIKMVYPARCPDGAELLPDNSVSVDLEKLFKFLSMVNDYDTIKCLHGKKAVLSEEEKQILRDMGRKVSSGEFAADNNLEVENSVHTKTLDFSSFTKEF
jgi:5''-3'' exonuclease (including N-terminal domain of PolI)